MSAKTKAGELAMKRFEDARDREKRSKERQQQLKIEALRGISLDAKSKPSAATSPFNGVGHKLGTSVKTPIKINTVSPLKKIEEDRLILEMVRIIQHPEEFSSDEIQVAKDCFIGILKNDDGENRTFLETCYEQVKHELSEVSVNADADDLQSALDAIANLEAQAIFEDDGLQAALEEIAKLEAHERDEEQAFQAALALSIQEH